MTKAFTAALTRVSALFVLVTSPSPISGAPGSNDLLTGQKYQIVGQLYAHNVSDDLKSRTVSTVTLVPLRLTGPEIISRKLVPKGSVLTIVGKAPKKAFAFLYPDRYIVSINTVDAPTGVPVVIDLSRGIEGKSTVLNPQIFQLLF